MDSTLIDVHLEAGWWRTTLEHDVRSGLGQDNRSIPAKWFYDEVGSQLFDDITKLDEYYPFRAEREVLRTRAAEIVNASDADTLVELGLGHEREEPPCFSTLWLLQTGLIGMCRLT